MCSLAKTYNTIAYIIYNIAGLSISRRKTAVKTPDLRRDISFYKNILQIKANFEYFFKILWFTSRANGVNIFNGVSQQ